MSAQLNPVEYFVCGGVGGMCTVLVGHPLDTVKVRLQTMPVVKLGELPMYRGTWDCLAKTVQNEGVKGLYKGMAAPLTGVSPIFAISFFGYGVGKQIFKANVHDKSMPRIFAAGAFSGIFTTVIMTPGERIKCLLQIQQGQVDKKYAGPVDCAKQLYRAGGMKSIYRGTVATLLRDVPASGLYFLTYETLSAYFTKVGEKPSIATTIFAGGMAGISNWLVGMPADVLKSRLQTAPEGTYKHGLKEVFAELMRKEGVFALYKGITPVMLRAFPANAACFLGFELAAGVIKRLHSS